MAQGTSINIASNIIKHIAVPGLVFCKSKSRKNLQLQCVPRTTRCGIFRPTGLARTGNIAQWAIAVYYRMPFARLVLRGSVLNLTCTYTHNENNHHR